MSDIDKKSIIELRGIAQSLGMIPKSSWTREELLNHIKGYTNEKIREPEPSVVINIVNQPDDRNLTQAGVLDALKGFIELGVTVTFPDNATWQIECDGRKDSGSMSMSLWSMIQCVKALMQK